jgi:Fe2+ transport system protein FeoA
MKYSIPNINEVKIKHGSTYNIRKIYCDKMERRRLAEIGILEGTSIKVCGSNNSTYRILVRDSYFALGAKIFNAFQLEAEHDD